MNTTKNDIKNKDLKKRILDISFKHNLSHLGSCITAVDIIDEIFHVKKPDEKFILSSGHSGLGLYVVLEKYLGLDAEKIFNHHGVHPDRCEECHIDCSSGSLGQGLPIAVGMALADRNKKVYCLISDGECSEGSVAEAWRIIGENSLINLKLYINWNGWGAYKKIDNFTLPKPILPIDHKHNETEPVVYIKNTNMENWPDWLQGQAAHYVAMNEEQYQEALKVL